MNTIVQTLNGVGYANAEYIIVTGRTPGRILRNARRKLLSSPEKTLRVILAHKFSAPPATMRGTFGDHFLSIGEVTFLQLGWVSSTTKKVVKNTRPIMGRYVDPEKGSATYFSDLPLREILVNG